MNKIYTLIIIWFCSLQLLGIEDDTTERHSLQIEINNNPLTCELTLPKTGNNCPLIVWSPAGDAKKSFFKNYHSFVDTLAQEGCAVLQVAFNGDDAKNRSIHFNQLIKKIVGQKNDFWSRIDFDRIAVGGHSRGGSAAFASIASNKSVTHFIGLNASHPISLGKGSATKIKRKKVHALLIAGDHEMKGQSIDLVAAEALYELIERSVILIQFNKLDHNLKPQETLEELSKLTVSWLSHTGFIAKKEKSISDFVISLKDIENIEKIQHKLSAKEEKKLKKKIKKKKK